MPVIALASAAHLRELLGRAATWVKLDKRAKQYEQALPPAWVVETIQGRTKWDFPTLEGIVCSPTLRPDGSLLANPGYDETTGLYLDCNGTTFPALRAHPTLDDARSALGRLQEVFEDFPFAEREPDALTNPSFSATLAAVLTFVCRAAIQGNTPMFGVTATAAGSGKGLLVDAIALIGTGRVAPKMGQTTDEDEELKRLLALALAGTSLCCIDNCTYPLGNQYLEMALTARAITGRILGQTGMAEAPWQAVLCATGNNLSYRGDFVRRVVPICLDAQMEKPEERADFRHPNLERWVQQERPQLVVAALTIVRAYFLAGCPAQGLTPYGSFEAWSDLVRSALVWLGEADPCEGRKDLAAQTDEAYEQLAVLLAAWEACYPPQAGKALPERTITQIKQDIAEFRTRVADQPPNTWDAFHQALIPFDKKFDGKGLDAHRVGNALRVIEGRVIGQKRLKRHGAYRHNALWRVEKI
jgi:putative DNA primase/helicase